VQAFGIVDKAGKDDHAEDQEEDQEGELLGAGLERSYLYESRQDSS
jgi:hypothetical protein